MKKHEIRNSGFTIVELLVVIAIIGILAAIAIVSYTGVSQKAMAVSLQSDLSNSSDILKLYQTEYGTYPQLLDGNYCPVNPADSRYCLDASNGSTYSYSSSAPWTSFTLTETNATYNITYIVTDNSAPIPVTVPSLSNSGNGSWSKKSTVTITNFQPNFQTLISVSYRASMKADFSDVRFYDATSATELQFWIESYTSSTTASIWVKTGSNNNVVMYYGNSSATAASNGTNTFDYFDDFSGNFSDKWSIVVQNNGGTASNGSGLMTLFAPKATGGTIYVQSKTTVPNTGVFRSRRKMTPSAGISLLYVAGPQNTTYQSNTNDCVNNELRIGGTVNDCGINPVNVRTDDNTWHNIDISYSGTNSYLYIDGVLKQTIVNSPGDNAILGAAILNSSWKTSDNTTQFDYVFVRKYNATDPTTSVGSEASA